MRGIWESIGASATAKAGQWAFTILAGFAGTLDIMVVHFVPCIALIVLDIFSAHALGKRVSAKQPDKADGKFKSKYITKVLQTFCVLFIVLLVGAHVDIIRGEGQTASNAVMLAFIVYQLWSVLENWSSERGDNGKRARVAKALQRYMVNKAERHFNIPLNEILQEANGGEVNITINQTNNEIDCRTAGENISESNEPEH